MAAAKPFRPSITPTSYEVKVIGAVSTPPSAPSAAASTKLTRITPRVEMPISCAASGLKAVARIALPYSVRPKNQPSTSTASAVPPSTHRLCGRIVAPNSAIGSAPVNAGSGCTRLSHSTCASPRRNSATPMVMMISVTTSARPVRCAGSMASFSTTRPTDAGHRHRQRHRGRTAAARAPTSDTAAMPPIITNSPCAKLIAWLAL